MKIVNCLSRHHINLQFIKRYYTNKSFWMYDFDAIAVINKKKEINTYWLDKE